MKISIKYRLFLAFLLATGTLVACMFLIMQISFDRGFLRYINNLEQPRLERLAKNLESAYVDHGNWDFLRNNPADWIRFLSETLPDNQRSSRQLLDPEKRIANGSDRNSWPPRRMMRRFPHQFEWRVFLLDDEQNLIFGPHRRDRNLALIPLSSSGRQIGYLGIIPPRQIVDPLQLQFARKQRRSFTVIALIMAGAAALLSIPLAKQLVKRITTLAAATNRLAAGNYETRVPVSSSDELGQLAQDFNTLARTLEKNQEVRRQWIADISHELRTPLAVLRGEIEAQQDGVREQSTQSLAVLHGEVMHLHRLVEDLYHLSLADIGALSYRKETVDLCQALPLAIAPFERKFEARRLRLDCSIPADAPILVLADERRLHQLFGNLLENTLRYTDSGGELQMSVTKEKDKTIILFEDSAPGVPADMLERLFDRLFRVERSRSRATGGAGLGLALCKSIVESHEGSITARPSRLGGLCVEIILPLKGPTP